MYFSQIHKFFNYVLIIMQTIFFILKYIKHYSSSSFNTHQVYNFISAIHLEFYFSGIPPPINWTKISHLVADHVAAGSFESAARLLHDQVGIVNFKPYESLFMSIYSASRTVSTWQSNIPPSFSYPLRNWKDLKNGLPAISVKLNDLVARLQVNTVHDIIKIKTSFYVTQFIFQYYY